MESIRFFLRPLNNPKKHFSFDAPRFLIDFDLRRIPSYFTDVLVIGSGLAGLSAALTASKKKDVILLAKGKLKETNTDYAQGGVAAVLSPGDSFELHIADTLAAGQGLGDANTIQNVVSAAPAAVQQLLQWGARFDRLPNGELELAREGGHSKARIVHAHGASTGHEIQRALTESVGQAPRVNIFEQVFVLDLLTNSEGRCVGALGWSEEHGLVAFGAGQVILATGGAGQIYRETTNPEIATGDGIAMAFRAGAKLQDLEFIQFHPTTLYIAGAARVLISEVVRGEGGILRDRLGRDFMKEDHPDAELAPRDVVSRAITRRMAQTQDTNVYLDLSQIPGDVAKKFPRIAEICRFFDIDIRRDWIPVRPGAHYFVGGIAVDSQGRSSLPGLWVCGESSSTGLHGANRIGSNSLLECIVYGQTAGSGASEAERGEKLQLQGGGKRNARQDPSSVGLNLDDMVYSLKSMMGRDVGVERSKEGLQEAVERLHFWGRYLYRFSFENKRGWELVNMLTVAHLVALAALQREESRGVHFRSDFPKRDDANWARRLSACRVMDGVEFSSIAVASPAAEAAGSRVR